MTETPSPTIECDMFAEITRLWVELDWIQRHNKHVGLSEDSPKLSGLGKPTPPESW